MSERVAGVEFVGPIPEDLQKITTFSAAIPVGARSPVDVQRLIDYLSSPEVAADIVSTGLTPVVLDYNG